MKQSNSVAIVMKDDGGFFIRSGATKYRPVTQTTGLRKGLTVKAWPAPGGLKVEVAPSPAVVWPKEII